MNLGHGDPTKLHPRNPRFDFEEACRIVQITVRRCLRVEAPRDP